MGNDHEKYAWWWVKTVLLGQCLILHYYVIMIIMFARMTFHIFSKICSWPVIFVSNIFCVNIMRSTILKNNEKHAVSNKKPQTVEQKNKNNCNNHKSFHLNDMIEQETLLFSCAEHKSSVQLFHFNICTRFSIHIT